MNEVKPGQIYADMDPRCAGRTLRVDSITVRAGIPVAVCTILTNVEGAVTDRVGGKTTINVGRFTEANYKLIGYEE